MSQSFGFVLNLYHYEGKLPLEVIPGIELTRSNPLQTKMIQEFLREREGSFVAGTGNYFVRLWEREPVGGESHISIPEHELSFWILQFAGSPQCAFSLCDAAKLSESEIEVCMTYDWNAGCMNIHPLTMFHFSQAHHYPVRELLEADDIKDIRLCYDSVEKLKAATDDASKAVARVYSDFLELSNGVRFGHLPLLGHFALIEALLTLDPHKFGDSLNHQLSTKIPLLMHRFDPALEFSFFGVPDAKKLWKLLYEVRSSYAHGGSVDFAKGNMRQLKNFGLVYSFVRRTLKRLLLHAIKEPQLIFDLKEV